MTELCPPCEGIGMCTIRREVESRIKTGQSLQEIEFGIPGAAGCPQVDEIYISNRSKAGLIELREPVEPERQAKPAQPLRSANKIEPARSGKPPEQGKSKAKTERIASDKPTKSEGSKQSGSPDKPAKARRLVALSNLTKQPRPTETTKPVEPIEPVKPEEPIKPVETEEVTRLVAPLTVLEDAVIFQFSDPELSSEDFDEAEPEVFEVGEFLTAPISISREDQELLQMVGVQGIDEELINIEEESRYKPKITPEQVARVSIRAELNRYELSRGHKQTVEEIMSDFDIQDDDDVQKFLGLLKMREIMGAVFTLHERNQRFLHNSAADLSDIPMTEQQSEALKRSINSEKDRAQIISIQSKQDLYVYLIHRIGRQWAIQVNLRERKKE